MAHVMRALQRFEETWCVAGDAPLSFDALNDAMFELNLDRRAPLVLLARPADVARMAAEMSADGLIPIRFGRYGAYEVVPIDSQAGWGMLPPRGALWALYATPQRTAWAEVPLPTTPG